MAIESSALLNCNLLIHLTQVIFSLQLFFLSARLLKQCIGTIYIYMSYTDLYNFYVDMHIVHFPASIY